MIRKTISYKGFRISQHYASTGFAYTLPARVSRSVYTSLREAKGHVNRYIEQATKNK